MASPPLAPIYEKASSTKSAAVVKGAFADTNTRTVYYVFLFIIHVYVVIVAENRRKPKKKGAK